MASQERKKNTLGNYFDFVDIVEVHHDEMKDKNIFIVRPVSAVRPSSMPEMV